MNGSRIPWSDLGLAVVAIALLTTPVRAQASVGADLQVASQYRWRGVTRTQGWVIQPALSGSTGELCSGSQFLCLSA